MTKLLFILLLLFGCSPTEPDIFNGCLDFQACNYNSNATNDDSSCEYPEENFDCDGNCTVDTDCEGVCAGDALVDECGECGSIDEFEEFEECAGITETDSDGNLIGNIDPDDWCEFEFDMDATDSDFGLNPVYPNPLTPQEWGPFGNSYRVCYQYSTPFDSTWSNFNNIDINIISFENDTIYSYNDEYANGQIAICSYIAADSVVVNSIYRMYMSSDEYNCHGDIQFEE
jgi:hypothetical protein